MTLDSKGLIIGGGTLGVGYERPFPFGTGTSVFCPKAFYTGLRDWPVLAPWALWLCILWLRCPISSPGGWRTRAMSLEVSVPFSTEHSELGWRAGGWLA